YRIIDRDRLGRCERLRFERDKSEIASGLGHAIGDRLHTVWIELAVFIEQNRSAKQEVAAVPEITGLHIFSGRSWIRLLDEFCNRTDLPTNHFARADVAVLGGRTLGLNAKCHDASGIGSYQALATGEDKSIVIAHHVIGSERQNRGILVTCLGK